jgi:hypothetical protein
MRRAASGLYNVTSAVILAAEGAHLGDTEGDWSRAVLAAQVVRHKLLTTDPLADHAPIDGPTELALIERESIGSETLTRLGAF